MSNKKKPWWDEWYVIRCPECDSKNVETENSYKYTFNKKKKEVQKYICKKCGLEFWE